LETLGGFGKKPDQPSPKALSRRDIGVGLGQYDLRSGFFNNRSHDVGVSMGKVSLNKKRDQTSHAIGFKGPIPTCIYISDAKLCDVKYLDALIFEPGAIYIMDKGYIDWARLHQIASAGAFFVIRAKDNLRFTRYKSQSVDKGTGLRSDQIGKLSIPKSRGDFPAFLRKVPFYDEEKKKHLIFLTNNLQIPALTVAKLYKKRWEIELFFKWIKGNLEIKHYYGTSPNAVKTQIWIAVSLYLMVAILHKSLKLPGSLRNTLQILSVHPFDKTPLNELLMDSTCKNKFSQENKQLELLGL
jgi:transposase